MTDAPSHHDEWYLSDDVPSSGHPTPAPAPLSGPTLTPPATDPSLGLRGLLAAVIPTEEPSLGLGGVEIGSAITPDDGAVLAPTNRAERLVAALAAVPIERVAPLTAIAFVCSLLVWAIVQVLF